MADLFVSKSKIYIRELTKILTILAIETVHLFQKADFCVNVNMQHTILMETDL